MNNTPSFVRFLRRPSGHLVGRQCRLVCLGLKQNDTGGIHGGDNGNTVLPGTRRHGALLEDCPRPRGQQSLPLALASCCVSLDVVDSLSPS